MVSYEENISLEDIFGSGGVFSKRLANYEARQEQKEMAAAIESALQKRTNAVIEAGTGIGKSFAYLVPAIIYACQKGGRILISTFTINLQEQLINKDIPFLADHLNFDFQAHLAKGRGNYLCKRRLEFAKINNSNVFDQAGMELDDIYNWAKTTSDGSLSSMDVFPSSAVWDLVKSEHGNCKGRKCQHNKECFYQKARRQLEKANIIVANHALLLSDLILKSNDIPQSILPEYKSIIIDEAHNIESVAEEHFGIDISSFGISFLLSGIYNTKTKRGLLKPSDDAAIEIVKQCTEQAKIFFRNVSNWYDQNSKNDSKRCPPKFVSDNLSEHFKQLRAQLNLKLKTTVSEDAKFEIQRAMDRIKNFQKDINDFIEQTSSKSQIYWVELSKSGSKKYIRLKSAPVKVAENLKKVLFDCYESVILTSATLSCGSSANKQENSFEFFAESIGLENYDKLQLDSPFDYQRQVKLYIEKRIPDPNTDEFIDAAAEAIKKYVLITNGRAFVLFTSYSMLDKVSRMLENWFSQNNLKLLRQANNIDRSALLREFKTDTGCVLFGTDSFWQGVDVPGDALSNVIITKLPFAVPNHPLIEGKIERLRKEGKNPFFEFQLPSAIIKFKQGFGRLIRTKSDKGIVAVLDNRISSKAYGKMFINAIPKCQIIDCP